MQIEFWDGCVASISSDQIAPRAIPVKGALYRNPLRFLEIYANSPAKSSLVVSSGKEYPCESIRSEIFPSSIWRGSQIGEGIFQPPFLWSDCAPEALAVNFTYNTNAIYRILNNLAEQGLINRDRVDTLLDDACLLLTHVYKANSYEIIKSINNNLNMYIISKVVEILLGKTVYDSEMQEFSLAFRTLNDSLSTVAEYGSLDVRQRMALSLGKGISYLDDYTLGCGTDGSVDHGSRIYMYYSRNLAIDDRDVLIDRVAEAQEHHGSISICAILDDAAESVDDLLWMQELMDDCDTLRVFLLVNTAQVSVNFSVHMLEAVLRDPGFVGLTSRLNRQFFVVPFHCPLISYQANFFTENARKAIEKADIVYVKGANFFETLQIAEKDTFYAFVVFGPVSRLYTGLRDFDGVFAYVPKGTLGYYHSSDRSEIVTLQQICKTRSSREPSIRRFRETEEM